MDELKTDKKKKKKPHTHTKTTTNKQTKQNKTTYKQQQKKTNKQTKTNKQNNIYRKQTSLLASVSHHTSVVNSSLTFVVRSSAWPAQTTQWLLFLHRLEIAEQACREQNTPDWPMDSLWQRMCACLTAEHLSNMLAVAQGGICLDN